MTMISVSFIPERKIHHLPAMLFLQIGHIILPDSRRRNPVTYQINDDQPVILPIQEQPERMSLTGRAAE
jgi:Tfp pilus assembly protein PilZ